MKILRFSKQRHMRANGRTVSSTVRAPCTIDNGDKYADEWCRGTYVCEWQDGKQHGQGTYTREDGSEYVGEFKEGKAQGQGTYTYSSGDKYAASGRTVSSTVRVRSHTSTAASMSVNSRRVKTRSGYLHLSQWRQICGRVAGR